MALTCWEPCQPTVWAGQGGGPWGLISCTYSASQLLGTQPSLPLGMLTVPLSCALGKALCMDVFTSGILGRFLAVSLRSTRANSKPNFETTVVVLGSGGSEGLGLSSALPSVPMEEQAGPVSVHTTLPRSVFMLGPLRWPSVPPSI